MKEMPQICGFNECSEAGIDVFAPAIFMNGCNFRCPYCMNSKLARGESEKNVDIEDIKAYVLEDKSKWFMISGGEPTCTDIGLLTNLLEEIKSWGCKIGMSTNGSNPEDLRTLMPLLNYVAMDFKATRMKDLKEMGVDGVINMIQSRSILVNNKDDREDFDFEIRTTLYPKYVDEKTIAEMGGIFRKSDTWVLQQFRQAKHMLGSDAYDVEPYTQQEVTTLAEIAGKYSDNVKLRDV